MKIKLIIIFLILNNYIYINIVTYINYMNLNILYILLYIGTFIIYFLIDFLYNILI